MSTSTCSPNNGVKLYHFTGYDYDLIGGRLMSVPGIDSDIADKVFSHLADICTRSSLKRVDTGRQI